MENEIISEYVSKQLNNLLPDNYIINNLDAIILEVLNELSFNKIKIWKENPVLDILNSLQYPIFLYKLSHKLYLINDIKGAKKVFYLNKILHTLDLFYEIDLKEEFLLGHGIGSVFCKVEYGNYSVYGHNILIGVDHGKGPQLNEGLILFPNASIIGNCKVGKNVVVSTNTMIKNTNIPNDVIVFSDNNKLIFKDIDEYYAQRYFEID